MDAWGVDRRAEIYESVQHEYLNGYEHLFRTGPVQWVLLACQPGMLRLGMN